MNEFIKKELDSRGNLSDYYQALVKEASDEIEIEDSNYGKFLKVVPKPDMEEQFNYASGYQLSEGFKDRSLIELFKTSQEPDTFDMAEKFVDEMLLSEDKVIHCDLIDIKNRKHYVEVLGEMIETPAEMTPQQFLDYCKACAEQAISKNKITQEDLNPKYYQPSNHR